MQRLRRMDYQRAVERPDRGFSIGAMLGGGALLASIAVAIYPNHKADPDRECSGLSQLGDIAAWWDDQTRTLVTSVYYAYGGCMCGGQTDPHVKRLP